MRTEWISRRAGDPNKTQLHYARAGSVTEEMVHVAERERVDPELVRSEVARGRMVIPANVEHTNLSPMGIGIALSCKVNANIGNSAVTSGVEGELRKLAVALRFGADTVMDLSTGGDIDRIRATIIASSPVPIGTVPIYQVLKERKNVASIRADDCIDMLEHQAKQGVDYFTIHAGVLAEHLPLVQHRITGIVSRGGSVMAQWMIEHKKQNPFYTHWDARATTSPSARATAFDPDVWPTRATPRSSRSSRRWVS
jgi:phosphomethylpyrimidine synthase